MRQLLVLHCVLEALFAFLQGQALLQLLSVSLQLSHLLRNFPSLHGAQALGEKVTHRRRLVLFHAAVLLPQGTLLQTHLRLLLSKLRAP